MVLPNIFSLTMFSISALCLTPHWNMPVRVMAYDRARPTAPGSISETSRRRILSSRV